MRNDDGNKPRIGHDIDASRIKRQESEENAQPADEPSRYPTSSDFIGSLDFLDAEDSVDVYKEALKRAPGFPWSHTTVGNKPVILLAPYLTGVDVDRITPEQIVAGVYINIPRSKTLWKGDHIKVVWGYNTFYTTLEENPHRDEPRLVQYLNSEQLVNYQNGEVHVHYEVVRRSRLVGVYERLKINLEGKGRPRSGTRRRSMRRKGF